jgi:4-hydroxy-3-polyprenylbenzoate decarboxylase
MQIYDNCTTGMHWQVHKDGAEHWRRERAGNQDRMEVAVAIGCDPATVYAASAPLPYGVDEFLLSGFIRNKPLELVKCQTVDLEVPAESEIVLEGYVDLKEMRPEGPFGDHTGFYTPETPFPVFHITRMTMKKNPVYLTTVVGRPPMEDCFMGYATERIFLPLIQKQLPEVRDIHMPFEGVFHNCLLISIRKSFPFHARKVMSAVWGLGQMMFAKCVVVFDEEANIQNVKEAAWRAFNNVDPKRDIIFTEGPVDQLDHSASQALFGSKMGIDATRKLPEEGMQRPWPEEMKMSEEMVKRVSARWEEYGLNHEFRR